MIFQEIPCQYTMWYKLRSCDCSKVIALYIYRMPWNIRHIEVYVLVMMASKTQANNVNQQKYTLKQFNQKPNFDQLHKLTLLLFF